MTDPIERDEPMPGPAFMRKVSQQVSRLPSGELRKLFLALTRRTQVQARRPLLEMLEASIVGDQVTLAPGPLLLQQVEEFLTSYHLDEDEEFDEVQGEEELPDGAREPAGDAASGELLGDELREALDAEDDLESALLEEELQAEWAQEMDGLLCAALDEYHDGDRALAQQALRRLLLALGEEEALRLELVHPQAVLEADLQWAVACCLRALYDSTPLPRRPRAVLEEMQSLAWLVEPPPGLGELQEVDPAPMPELESFLPMWHEILQDPELDELDLDVDLQALRGEITLQPEPPAS